MPGKLEVALIAAGNGHDCAGAVVHQHVVGYPNRNQSAVDGVLDIAAGERPVLGALPYLPLDGGLAGRARHNLVDCVRVLVALDQPSNQRMLGGEQEERAAEQRVRSSGEYGDALVGGLVGLVTERELDLGAFATADPVGLHALDALGPAGQLVEVVEEPLRVLGDLEVPLLKLAFLDNALAPPALAVADDLLVGEDRRAAGAPVDRRALALDQPALPHLQEDPLSPAVVVDVTALDRAVPVVGEAHTLERLGLLLDVGVGPRRRMAVALDRGVLGRQTEGVPADGV